MRILLISPLPPPAGGIATWTQLYLKSKIAKDNEIDLVNTAVTGLRVNNFVKRSIISEIKRALKIRNCVKNYIKKNKYDLVHLNTSCSKLGMFRDYMCAKLANKNNIKLVLHCHCDTAYMINGKISEFIFKKLCKASDNIIVLNTNSKEHLKRLTSLSSNIIPNFFDINTYKNINKKYISREINEIIYVGHIIKSKGCLEIIEVAKKMPNITFKLIGYLSDEIKEINVTKNVKYLGEISKEDVINNMLSADLLLFPSHTEGFPNVVLEAMACGLPIIASEVGAIPDMLEEHGGIIVPVNNVDEIIKSIFKISDINERKRISQWSQAKVIREYSVETIMKRIFKEYTSIVKERVDEKESRIININFK